MASPASPLTSLGVSQKQEAGREGCGEGDREDPAEHWWPPQPGKPGEQLLAGCGGLSLVHHGDDGDAQVSRRLKKTQLEGQQWLQSQVSPWFCRQPLRQTGWPARPPSQSCGRLPARELARPPFLLQNLNQIKSAGAQILTSFHFYQSRYIPDYSSQIFFS